MDKLQKVVDLHRAKLKKAGYTDKEADEAAKHVAEVAGQDADGLVKAELEQLDRSPFKNLLTAAVLGSNCVQLGLCELISVPAHSHEVVAFGAEVRKGIAFLQAALKVADHMLETGAGLSSEVDS